MRGSPDPTLDAGEPTATRSGDAIMVLVDFGAVGGGSVVAGALASRWVAAGRRTHIAALADIEPAIPDRFPTVPWVPLHATGHAGRVRSLRRHLLTLQGAPPTILAIGEYAGIVAVIARASARRLRSTPIVLAEHQPFSLGAVLRARGRLAGAIATTVVRVLRRRTDASICLSQEQRVQLRREGLVSDARSVVIPNPCMLPPADEELVRSRTARMRDGSRVRLLAVGSLNEAKDYPMLLGALARLDRRHHLTIVGNGDPTELMAATDALGVRDRVAFAGPLSDVAPVMDSHDILVLTSRYESFGLVVVEAIVRGLPVVATACNTTLPLLSARIDSLRITPVGDPAACAAAVMDVSATTWTAGGLMENARTLACAHDPATVAAAHLDLFDAVRTRPALTR